MSMNSVHRSVIEGKLVISTYDCSREYLVGDTDILDELERYNGQEIVVIISDLSNTEQPDIPRSRL